MLVCHQCDNKKCVNPSHLFLGTYSDNLNDSLRKGRKTFRPTPHGLSLYLKKMCKCEICTLANTNSGRRYREKIKKLKIKKLKIKKMNFLNKLLGPKQKKDGKFYSMCLGGCKEQCQECKDLEKSVTIKYKEMKIQSDVFISKFFEVLEKSNFSPKHQQRIKDCFSGSITHHEASMVYRAAFKLLINDLKPLEDECEKLKHRVNYLEGIYEEKVLEKASLGNEIVRLEKLVNEKNGIINLGCINEDVNLRKKLEEFNKKQSTIDFCHHLNNLPPEKQEQSTYHTDYTIYGHEIHMRDHYVPFETTFKKINNMEKTITMSLETALEFYKTTQDKILKDWLICNFGRDALEKKEGFTWEESFAGDGYFISDNSYIVEARIRYEDYFSKQFFKTRDQALSALAFAQLTHIVAKYNEGKESVEPARCFVIHKSESGHLFPTKVHKGIYPLEFTLLEGAETSLKVNSGLWNQYCMI